MYLERKLKPDYSIVGLIPAFFSLFVLFVGITFFGPGAGTKAFALVIFIYSLFSFYTFNQTKSIAYFFSAIYMLSLSLLAYFYPETKSQFRNLPEITKFFTATTLFLLLVMIYLLATRKVKWRGREIFELAALNIKEKGGGFTDRPMSVSKVDYSIDELSRFSLFVRKNLIAMTFHEKEKIFFVPVSMGDYAILYKPNYNYLARTWIAFDFDGNVSVHLSRKDYLNFREDYTFDLLINSLGNLFIEFLDSFQKDEGSRIIDRMNTFKINVFT